MQEFLVDELDDANDDFDLTQPLYMQKLEEVSFPFGLPQHLNL